MAKLLEYHMTKGLALILGRVVATLHILTLSLLVITPAVLEKIIFNIAESYPGLQVCMERCDLKEFNRTTEHITQQMHGVLLGLLEKLMNDRRKELLDRMRLINPSTASNMEVTGSWWSISTRSETRSRHENRAHWSSSHWPPRIGAITNLSCEQAGSQGSLQSCLLRGFTPDHVSSYSEARKPPTRVLTTSVKDRKQESECSKSRRSHSSKQESIQSINNDSLPPDIELEVPIQETRYTGKTTSDAPTNMIVFPSEATPLDSPTRITKVARIISYIDFISMLHTAASSCMLIDLHA